MAVRRSKYGVRLDAAGKAARTVDGVLFHSQREAKRFVLLRQWERLGQIHELQTQPKFPLSIEGVHLGHYVADFSYRRDGKYVVEDVKGHMTKFSAWKIAHTEAQYGITVEIVK